MSAPSLTFLVDVDNTLLDNDQVKSLLEDEIARLFPPPRAARFWELYEDVRLERDVIDFDATLARFRAEAPADPNNARLADRLETFPFERCVYPGALEALRHLASLGTTVVLSDGDAVYQPRKIARSGIAAAVDGNVLVYTHKERHLEEVERRFPADRYVGVDDKARLLAAMKATWGQRVTTVHVRQGHYAREPHDRDVPRADLEIGRIDELARLGRDDFLRA